MSPELPEARPATPHAPLTEPGNPPVVRPEHRDMNWVFIGTHGLRAGWSVFLFASLSLLFINVLGTVATSVFSSAQQSNPGILAPRSAIVIEVVQFFSVLAAGAILAFLEGRRILSYNLTGPRRILHFTSGLAAGFLALSALIGALRCGGWLRFGPRALSGKQIFLYAVAWSLIFLLTGLFEEGAFRCYLQSTLTRGINFWWALASVAGLCLYSLLTISGSGVWGVYGLALLGVFPCLFLHLRKTPRSSFWQAAWLTSTLFGFIHTSNGGENWIGIFAAGAIGFLFCVSLRLTGSAWWAIGCHATWDWTETFFYGTPDSGLIPRGHLLTTTLTGNPLWSGGADGPEGSLLVLPILLLLLLVLLAIYGRKKPTAPALEQAIG